jgi:hypothetical protein
MASPPNSMIVPTITYEYYSASHQVNSSTTHLTKGSGATVGFLYPRYHGPPFMAQKSGYGQFPPAADDWETKHPVSDMVPPLLAEEKGLPT